MESKFYQVLELQKAKDKALWLNFSERVKPVEAKDHYFVVDGPEFFSVVNRQLLEELETESLYPLPESYHEMTWKEIKTISKDKMPLSHWEELFGSIATMDGEVLRFILEYKVNIFRIIRTVLASRGYDKNNKWVGFDKSEEIWKADDTI